MKITNETLKLASKSLSQFSTALRTLSKLVDQFREDQSSHVVVNFDQLPQLSEVQETDVEEEEEMKQEKNSSLPTAEWVATEFLARTTPRRRTDPEYGRIGMFLTPTQKLFEIVCSNTNYRMNASRDLLYKGRNRCNISELSDLFELCKESYVRINEKLDKLDKKTSKKHFGNFQTWNCSSPLCLFRNDMSAKQKSNKNIVCLHEFLKQQVLKNE